MVTEMKLKSFVKLYKYGSYDMTHIDKDPKNTGIIFF